MTDGTARSLRLGLSLSYALLTLIAPSGCFLYSDDGEEPLDPALLNLPPSAFVSDAPTRTLLGETVSLSGEGSYDPDGTAITYSWSFDSRPEGSAATLTGADQMVTSFVADIKGPYTVRLTVSDGQVSDYATTIVMGTPLPTVTALEPSHGTAGTFVKVVGTDFYWEFREDDVYFNGVQANVVGANPTWLGMSAPASTTGPVELVTMGHTVRGPVFTYDPPGPCTPLEPVADTYIRGGSFSDTPHGTAGTLIIKGIANVEWARKMYLVFDVSALPASFSTVALQLTLDRHTAANPRDASLYGIIDNADWDPATLSEKSMTWNNAPRNVGKSGIAFTDQGTTAADGVRMLTTATLDNADPSGTIYQFDITDYVNWAMGNNPAFSTPAPAGDIDGRITLLLAHSAEINGDDGSVFASREDADACNRPQLVFQ